MVAQLVEAEEWQKLTGISVTVIPWTRNPGAWPLYQLLWADPVLKTMSQLFLPGIMGDTSQVSI